MVRSLCARDSPSPNQTTNMQNTQDIPAILIDSEALYYHGARCTANEWEAKDEYRDRQAIVGHLIASKAELQYIDDVADPTWQLTRAEVCAIVEGDFPRQPDEPEALNWTELYSLSMGNAGAHRATGVRKASDRALGHHLPLPAYVSSDVAHCAFADRFVRFAEDVPAYRLTFDGVPTTVQVKTLIGTTTAKQANAVSEIGYAITGSRSGSRHTTVELPEVTEENEEGALSSPLAELETREEVAAILAILPPVCRDTIARLSEGEGCPDDLNRATWRRRCSDARQEFRALWLERNG